MPENQNPAPAFKKAKIMDTTQKGIREAYLDPAGKALGKKGYHTAPFQLAMLRWILDAAKVIDPELRQEVWKQMQATPGWFACNNSSCRQLAYKGEKAEEENELPDIPV